jgi:hypothetical protein
MGIYKENLLKPVTMNRSKTHSSKALFVMTAVTAGALILLSCSNPFIVLNANDFFIPVWVLAFLNVNFYKEAEMKVFYMSLPETTALCLAGCVIPSGLIDEKMDCKQPPLHLPGTIPAVRPGIITCK